MLHWETRARALRSVRGMDAAHQNSLVGLWYHGRTTPFALAEDIKIDRSFSATVVVVGSLCQVDSRSSVTVVLSTVVAVVIFPNRPPYLSPIRILFCCMYVFNAVISDWLTFDFGDLMLNVLVSPSTNMVSNFSSLL